MRKVVSRDGTTIAYQQAGDGPPLVLLGGGFRDHTIFNPIVPGLAPYLSTYVYDRRGRGESGDSPAYAVEREIEDLAAVIAEAGGEAAVFGGSSGAILALEAAMADIGITRLVLLEPPYRMPGQQRPPDGFAEHLQSLLDQEKRGAAAEYFLEGMVGFTPEEIATWRAGPMWPANEAVAHTLPYDTAVCGDGRLPVERLARLDVPTLVINSDSTSEWLRVAAEATAAALPNGRQVTLPGVWHKVPAEVLCPAVVEFVTGKRAEA
ncbi:MULTISPECIES: alpha/beta fold hydrolase [Micromonospora]|uniref:Pimeloyl-ACP methyl ester carboxylesterase n=1 Tax=Micromonospora yangpuensis TaxID=683228 RepID=A0A1C6UFN8_9ACTN|nr:alpha/beta hydrolase [Micromonospora yangpuensis]GGM05651.1 alpha/beta hydrolase [Micromonospora yangpuensis]SCL52768.1 Pimeloyl-ACP methyl ester carboxylesterase [Micromonospora yangpuensis]